MMWGSVDARHLQGGSSDYRGPYTDEGRTVCLEPLERRDLLSGDVLTNAIAHDWAAAAPICEQREDRLAGCDPGTISGLRGGHATGCRTGLRYRSDLSQALATGSWFTPPFPIIAEPAVVPVGDWSTALSLFWKELQTEEFTHGLAQQMMLEGSTDPFAWSDPSATSELVQQLVQGAGQAIDQPDRDHWPPVESVPTWLQVGAAVAGVTAVGTTVWSGMPDWIDQVSAHSVDLLDTDCADHFRGRRFGLPTLFRWGEGAAVGVELRGEYWPFGTDVDRDQALETDAVGAGFSNHVWFLSPSERFQWTSEIAIGFDQSGIQGGYFDITGSWEESRSRLDLAIAGAFADGPELDDGAGQLTVQFCGVGMLPLRGGSSADGLRLSVGVEYAYGFSNRRDHRSELILSGSLGWEY